MNTDQTPGGSSVPPAPPPGARLSKEREASIREACYGGPSYDMDLGDLLDELDHTRAVLASAAAEVERMSRGIVWAHYELAVNCKADTLWLMDLLGGLLAGKTADESADVARRTLAESQPPQSEDVIWDLFDEIEALRAENEQLRAETGGSDDV